MTELPPRPDDLSELDSVEVTEPKETQKYHKSSTSSVHRSSSQDGFNAIAFLRKNAFGVLTMVAVVLGIGLGFALRQIGQPRIQDIYLSWRTDDTNAADVGVSSHHFKSDNSIKQFIPLMNLLSLGVIRMNETRGINERIPVLGTSDGINTLGLLVFSVAFGLGTEGKPLRDFFDSLNKAIPHLISIVIWYSPVGTFFLLAGQIVTMTDAEVIGHEVAVFTATVITGLLIHSFLTLALIYFMITQKNPFRLFGGLL